jgi:outer membrane protein assembly factor BamB
MPYHASPAVTDDYVFIGSRDKQMHCIDRKTGQGVWKFAARGRIDSSPVVVGKRVFFGSADRNLYAVNIANGEQQFKFNAGGDLSASPAVGEGCLVIGAEGPNGAIFCLGTKAAKK